jgi:hypothetical protein
MKYYGHVEKGMVLLSRDTHFKNVRGLMLECW